MFFFYFNDLYIVMKHCLCLYWQMETFIVSGSSLSFEEEAIIRDNVEEFSEDDLQDEVPDEANQDTKDVKMSSFYDNFNN